MNSTDGKLNWRDVLHSIGLDIGHRQFQRITRAIFPNATQLTWWRHSEAEKIISCYNKQSEELGFDVAKPGEVYVLIKREGQPWGVGSMSSTDLLNDRKRFADRGYDMSLITERQARNYWVYLFNQDMRNMAQLEAQWFSTPTPQPEPVEDDPYEVNEDKL